MKRKKIPTVRIDPVLLEGRRKELVKSVASKIPSAAMPSTRGDSLLKSVREIWIRDSEYYLSNPDHLRGLLLDKLSPLDQITEERIKLMLLAISLGCVQRIQTLHDPDKVADACHKESGLLLRKLPIDREIAAQVLADWCWIVYGEIAGLVSQTELGQARAREQLYDALGTSDLHANSWTNSIGMRFVPLGNDGWICTSLASVRDYQEFADSIQNLNDRWKSSAKASVGNSAETPVSKVNWHDAVAFCDWLTEKERCAGCIRSDARYRLPSSDEWISHIGSNQMVNNDFGEWCSDCTVDGDYSLRFIGIGAKPEGDSRRVEATSLINMQSTMFKSDVGFRVVLNLNP